MEGFLLTNLSACCDVHAENKVLDAKNANTTELVFLALPLTKYPTLRTLSNLQLLLW
jgi:hypothetical protein